MSDLQAEVEQLRAENQRLRAKINCTCGLLRRSAPSGATHRMYCPEYVGPLEHRWTGTRVNPTFGGVDYFCLCGGWFRQGGLAGHGDRTETAEPICSRAGQDWRGPRADPLP